MTAGTVDEGRLWDDLMALAAITDPDRPYTRRSFSDRFVAGRAGLRERFEAAGLEVRLDAAGNLIGRREGSDPAAGTILIGSHSDTVPSGGRFDGAAGVIAALEIARALAERGQPLRHALEVVDFLAEEPSEHGLSCIGSRGMVGALEPQMLVLRDASGETLADGIRRMGGEPEALERARRQDIVAAFELHIEQGRVLESAGLRIGVVSGIVGIARAEVRFHGRADHAGTTPMALRQDASVAAARLIGFAHERASELAGEGRGHVVATAGVVEVRPGAANIVPGEARLVFDVRAEDAALLHRLLDELRAQAEATARALGLPPCDWTLLSEAAPRAFAPELRALLLDSAERLGLAPMTLPSGAGHDAALVARIAPAAMVFVPCRDGRSHAPEEWAEAQDLAAGAAVIHEAVLRFDAAAATGKGQ